MTTSNLLFSASISLGALIALGGCRGDKGGEDSQSAPELSVSELVPTVVTLSWTTDQPTYGLVEYGLDGEIDQATPTSDTATTEHSVAVLGLKAGGTYDLRAVSVDESGDRVESEAQTVTLDLPPPEVSPLTITNYDPDRAAPGGFVLTEVITLDGTFTVIIDRDGDVVWYWQVDQGLSAYGGRFDPNTNSVYFLQVDQLGQNDLAGVLRVALDGSETAFTRTYQGHHDAVMLPDRTVGWLSYDFRFVDVEGEAQLTAGDSVLELPEGGGNEDAPTTRFAILDQEEPYVHCEHFYEEVFDTGATDFSHANSIIYDAERDVYLVMTRNLDALLTIDRATGEILTQVGGDHADIDTTDPEDGWSHGHMSHAWDGGFMMFDNGDHRTPKESRVSEYALDEEAGTLELVWTWADPDGLFNPFFGDAQKLTDTYFTTWTAYGRLEEITPEGEVVWRAETGLGAAIGRAIWTDDLYDLSDVHTF